VDEKTTETIPVVKRGEGWKPRNQRRRTFMASAEESHEPMKEESPRRPLPLPFGKIDVIA